MKAYVKPELFVERYELSQHIATCGIDMNYSEGSGCKGSLDGEFWPGLGGTVVFTAVPECEISPDAIEVYCYTVGTSEAGKTFCS